MVEKETDVRRRLNAGGSGDEIDRRGSGNLLRDAREKDAFNSTSKMTARGHKARRQKTAKAR